MDDDFTTLEKIKYFIIDHKKKIITGIILLILLITIIVFLTIDFSHENLFDSTKLFYETKQETIGFDKLKQSEDSIRYTLSAFVNVNNLGLNTVWTTNTSKRKYILDSGGSPNIVYNIQNGQLDIEIAYKSEDGVNEMYTFEMPHFPTQKWVQLCIVTNGRIVQLFKDGELFTAKKLHTAPWKSQRMLYLGKNNKNFNGYLGLVDYYNRALTPDEVRKLYKKRKRSLPETLYNYEQQKYLDSKNIIKGKIDEIKKI